MTVNEWIRAARKHSDMTQEELGEALGTTKGNVSSWEQGRHEPSLAQLVRIGQLTRFAEPLPGTSAGVSSVPSGRSVPLLQPAQVEALAKKQEMDPDPGASFLQTDTPVSAQAFAMAAAGPSQLALADLHNSPLGAGDQVIVDPCVSPRPGDFVVARWKGQAPAVMKYRVVGVDGANTVFAVASPDPNYPAARSDKQRIDILGTVVEYRKFLRPR